VPLFLTLETGDIAEVLLSVTLWIGFMLLFWTLIAKMSLFLALKAGDMAITMLLLLLGGYLQG
jgi:hypothetical protein